MSTFRVTRKKSLGTTAIDIWKVKYAHLFNIRVKLDLFEVYTLFLYNINNIMYAMQLKLMYMD